MIYCYRDTYFNDVALLGPVVIKTKESSLAWFQRVPQRGFAQSASYQRRKIAGCACAEIPRFPPLPRVSNPNMHHDTYVTHVPWCMSGSLTIGFLWSRGIRFRHSRCMRNPQFYVSGKRPLGGDVRERIFHWMRPCSKRQKWVIMKP